MTTTATNSITYERVHPPTVQDRINRLPIPARCIYEQVLKAMQNAEEIGGPEGQHYVDLMDAIIEEAVERRDYFCLTQG